MSSPDAVAARVSELTRKLDDELAINQGANRPEPNSSIRNFRRNLNPASYASIAIGETRAEAYQRKRELAKSLYVTPKP